MASPQQLAALPRTRDGLLLRWLLAALRRWLRHRWLCWGVGPVLSVVAGTACPVALLELALARKWVKAGSLIEYPADKGRGREEMIQRTRERIPLREQIIKFAMTIMGPPAWVSGIVGMLVFPRFIAAPGKVLPDWRSHLGKLLALAVLGDFGLYWGHRLQHEIAFMYKRFHSLHHKLETPTAASTACIDPVDAILQVSVPALIAAVAVQPHPLTLYAFLCLRTFENVMNHSGLDDDLVNRLTLKNLPLRAKIAHHDYHHKFSSHAGRVKNCGESFWVWDWLFGTLAATPVRKPGSTKG